MLNVVIGIACLICAALAIREKIISRGPLACAYQRAGILDDIIVWARRRRR